jgi:hypothetical protein
VQPQAPVQQRGRLDAAEAASAQLTTAFSSRSKPGSKPAFIDDREEGSPAGFEPRPATPVTTGCRNSDFHMAGADSLAAP